MKNAISLSYHFISHPPLQIYGFNPRWASKHAWALLSLLNVRLHSPQVHRPSSLVMPFCLAWVSVPRSCGWIGPSCVSVEVAGIASSVLRFDGPSKSALFGKKRWVSVDVAGSQSSSFRCRLYGSPPIRSLIAVSFWPFIENMNSQIPWRWKDWFILVSVMTHFIERVLKRIVAEELGKVFWLVD